MDDLLQELKAVIQKQTMCLCCERGMVHVRKHERVGEYIASVEHVTLQDHLCPRCYAWFHPRKIVFNPRPEFDDDGKPFDTIFADSVNEIGNFRRDTLLNDVNYWYALYNNEAEQFLGG